MTTFYKLHSTTGKPIHIAPPNTISLIPAQISPNIRCPHCMHMGAFTTLLPQDLQIQHIELRGTVSNQAPFGVGKSIVGLRACPNWECHGLVLCVISNGGRTIVLPDEILDFDPRDIPPSISASLEEAVKCHAAKCYKAAALMVRRVLEEVCEERGATGQDLKRRIQSLSTIIIIPQELLNAADQLRLLGNDAAHIEARLYQSIGENEVRLAIELTKEILKGVYQYRGLLDELRALANTTPAVT